MLKSIILAAAIALPAAAHAAPTQPTPAPSAPAKAAMKDCCCDKMKGEAADHAAIAPSVHAEHASH